MEAQAAILLRVAGIEHLFEGAQNEVSVRSVASRGVQRPPLVGCNVGHVATQALFESVTANWRSSRSGATGRLCRESVVALNFRFCLQRRPSFLRRRLMR